MTATHTRPDALAAAPMQAEEPPPPQYIDYGPGPGFYIVGCLNCRFCGDAGHPHKPERWMCARTMMECHEARNMPDACGYGARLYKDAISGR